MLQVSRAGYYQWLHAKPSKTRLRQEQLVQEIQKIHATNKDDYGSPRIHRELIRHGFRCSENTVAKVMRQAGIRARCLKQFRVATTDSKHNFPIAPNRLNQCFVAEKPDQVWLTDITYIQTNEGFTYLCAVEDLCSRRIVGWATSRQIDTKLTLDALQQAIDLRSPCEGLIVHSDRGSQYASWAYQERLADHGFQQSMSRKGNCYDNAPMESFFRSLKMEEVYWKNYATYEEATRGVIDYIDRFYNRERLHSSLDYVSPIEYEQHCLYELKKVG